MNVFDGAPIVSTYSRAQAIEDGVLFPLNGQHYPATGDAWIPEMVRQAGIRVPVCMTTGALSAYVAPIEGEGEQLAPCQDIKGRLWDVLWMTNLAMRCNSADDRCNVHLRVVPNIPIGSKRRPRPAKVVLWAHLGADDDGSACLTIMRPEDY